MLVTVAAQKGGVARTTTSVHLAAFLNQHAPTLLVDEERGGALDWADAGQLPFTTLYEADAGPGFNQHRHQVIDTGARASAELMANLAQHSDYLLIPTTPDALAPNALLKSLDALRGMERYGVLLTITPPYPSHDAAEARAVFEDLGVRLFKAEVPRAVAFQKAALAGVLVTEVRGPRASECWAAYEAGAEEVLQHARLVRLPEGAPPGRAHRTSDRGAGLAGCHATREGGRGYQRAVRPPRRSEVRADKRKHTGRLATALPREAGRR